MPSSSTLTLGFGIAVGCLASITAPAVAQMTGSILPDHAAALSTRTISQEDRARQSMDDYAICVVRTKTVLVKRALEQPIDAPINVAISRLASDDCLQNGELRMPAPLLRGALYRALYLNEYGSRDAAPGSPAPLHAAPADASPLQLFGNCVVEYNMEDARKTVLAAPATEKEQRAISGLTPALARCVAPGQQIHFSRSSLQAILAEAVYRRAAASTLVKN